MKDEKVITLTKKLDLKGYFVILHTGGQPLYDNVDIYNAIHLFGKRPKDIARDVQRLLTSIDEKIDEELEKRGIGGRKRKRGPRKVEIHVKSGYTLRFCPYPVHLVNIKAQQRTSVYRMVNTVGLVIQSIEISLHSKRNVYLIPPEKIEHFVTRLKEINEHYDERFRKIAKIYFLKEYHRTLEDYLDTIGVINYRVEKVEKLSPIRAIFFDVNVPLSDKIPTDTLDYILSNRHDMVSLIVSHVAEMIKGLSKLTREELLRKQSELEKLSLKLEEVGLHAVAKEVDKVVEMIIDELTHRRILMEEAKRRLVDTSHKILGVVESL